MMSLLRRMLSVFLIALLASGAFLSPALRHSHLLGESSQPASAEELDDHAHHHGHSHHHHSHHRHSHQPHGTGHRHAPERQPKPIGLAVEHVHFAIFGFEVTLPTSGSSSTNPVDSSQEWISLLSEMTELETTSVIHAIDNDELDRWELISTLEMLSSEQLFVPPNASPICDFARRECCGVLNV